jgi:hypothetical protein
MAYPTGETGFRGREIEDSAPPVALRTAKPQPLTAVIARGRFIVNVIIVVGHPAGRTAGRRVIEPDFVRRADIQPD